VVAEIDGFLAERIRWLEQHGVRRERIIVDPGLGFGKTLEHNLSIPRNIQSFKQHGCPVLIGHSRKSFLGQLFNVPLAGRDCPTSVVSFFCAQHGTDILRIHDVKSTCQALAFVNILENQES